MPSVYPPVSAGFPVGAIFEKPIGSVGGADEVRCDGSVYLKSAYPSLAARVPYALLPSQDEEAGHSGVGSDGDIIGIGTAPMELVYVPAPTSLYFALCANGVYASPDGKKWRCAYYQKSLGNRGANNRAGSASGNTARLKYCNGVLFVFRNTNNSKPLYSTDKGASWQTLNAAPVLDFADVDHDGTNYFFICTTVASCAYSPDLSTFTTVSLSTALSTTVPNAIAATAGRFVVVSGSKSTTSTDHGLTWGAGVTLATVGTSNSPARLRFLNNLFVLCMPSTAASSVQSTPDGAAWTNGANTGFLPFDIIWNGTRYNVCGVTSGVSMQLAHATSLAGAWSAVTAWTVAGTALSVIALATDGTNAVVLATGVSSLRDPVYVGSSADFQGFSWQIAGVCGSTVQYTTADGRKSQANAGQGLAALAVGVLSGQLAASGKNIYNSNTATDTLWFAIIDAAGFVSWGPTPSTDSAGTIWGMPLAGWLSGSKAKIALAGFGGTNLCEASSTNGGATWTFLNQAVTLTTGFFEVDYDGSGNRRDKTTGNGGLNAVPSGVRYLEGQWVLCGQKNDLTAGAARPAISISKDGANFTTVIVDMASSQVIVNAVFANGTYLLIDITGNLYYGAELGPGMTKIDKTAFDLAPTAIATCMGLFFVFSQILKYWSEDMKVWQGWALQSTSTTAWTNVNFDGMSLSYAMNTGSNSCYRERASVGFDPSAQFRAREIPPVHGGAEVWMKAA